MKTDARASPTHRNFGPDSVPSRQIVSTEKIAKKLRTPLDAIFGAHGGSLRPAAVPPTAPERLGLRCRDSAPWRGLPGAVSAQSRARKKLQDGSLNLSNAAQLQNLFERNDRSRGRPPVSTGAGGAVGGAPPSDGAPGEPGPAAPAHGGEHDPAPPAAGPVLDAAAREKLVRQAAGKSTREVQQMLAEVDPELAQPSDRLRALGGGRWELKAAVDAECRHGLEKLLMLLSHTDPHLTLGGLVARLVRDGLDRYDPARPPRVRRTGGGGSVDGAGSASTPALPVSGELNGSPANRHAEAELGRASRAVTQDGDGGAVSAAKQRAEDACGGAKSAAANDLPGPSAPKRPAEVEHGETNSTAVRDIVRCSDSAPKESAPVGDREGHTTSLAKRHSVTGHGSASRAAAPHSGAHTTSPAKCRSEAQPGRRPHAVARNGTGPAVPAAKRDTEAERGGSKSAPVRDTVRRSESAAKRLAYAAGHGAVGPAVRSPAVERHLAALRSLGAVPGSRSRYIPVAVKREVWRRDQGCCTYVDRRSGRRCGSRYRLEIDHIVPFALGGGAEPRNLTLHCRAHHRLRHAQRHAHAESVPNEARRAPVSAVDPNEHGRTVGSHAV